MPRFHNINFPFPYYNNGRFQTSYSNTASKFNRLKSENFQTENSNTFQGCKEDISCPKFENEANTRNLQNCLSENKKNKSNSFKEDYLFDLFGLKIYTDDVLLISLIYFLYSEGVKDESLFIVLILLLLS